MKLKARPFPWSDLKDLLYNERLGHQINIFWDFPALGRLICPLLFIHGAHNASSNKISNNLLLPARARLLLITMVRYSTVDYYGFEQTQNFLESPCVWAPLVKVHIEINLTPITALIGNNWLLSCFIYCSLVSITQCGLRQLLLWWPFSSLSTDGTVTEIWWRRIVVKWPIPFRRRH